MSPARPRPRPSRRGLVSARLWPCWRWRCWAGIWGWGGIAALWLRLSRARPRARPRARAQPQPQPRPQARSRPRPRPRPRPRARPRLLPGPAEDTHSAAAPAASAAVSPIRAPPLSSAAAGPEPPGPGAVGDARSGIVVGRSGAGSGPGLSADSRVSPAGQAQEAFQERYRLGSLMGRGGFGRVFLGTRLTDGAPVSGEASGGGGGGRGVGWRRMKRVEEEVEKGGRGGGWRRRPGRGGVTAELSPLLSLSRRWPSNACRGIASITGPNW